MVRAPASWYSMALETCSSPVISDIVVIVYCERALIVLDDPADGEEGLLKSSENRDNLGPSSVDGRPLS